MTISERKYGCWQTAVCAMIAVQPAWASFCCDYSWTGVTTGTSAEAQGEVSLGNTPESF